MNRNPRTGPRQEGEFASPGRRGLNSKTSLPQVRLKGYRMLQAPSGPVRVVSKVDHSSARSTGSSTSLRVAGRGLASSPAAEEDRPAVQDMGFVNLEGRATVDEHFCRGFTGEAGRSPLVGKAQAVDPAAFSVQISRLRSRWSGSRPGLPPLRGGASRPGWWRRRRPLPAVGQVALEVDPGTTGLGLREKRSRAGRACYGLRARRCIWPPLATYPGALRARIRRCRFLSVSSPTQSTEKEPR